MATGGWYYSHQGQKFGPFSAAPISFADLLTFLAERTTLTAPEVERLADALETGVEVDIEYEDQDGRSTARMITLNDLDDVYLDAFCHLRGDDRRFRLDRIRPASAVKGRRKRI